MPVRIRSTDLGIIYAASVANSGYTYVDRKGDTQDYITLTNTYTEMTTVVTGGVDISKPYLDATSGMTLAVNVYFSAVSAIKLFCKCRRADEASNPNAWFPIELVDQTSGTTASEITLTGSGEVMWGLQTSSQFTGGQISIFAKYSAGGPVTELDRLEIRCEAA